MKPFFCRTLSVVLATVLASSLATPTVIASAQLRQYNDFDAITSHVDTYVPRELSITDPSEDFSTTSSAYYITGTSDPNQTLTLNGEEVTGRGIFGSFGVYVALSDGENIFTFAQGGQEETVVITKSAAGTVATTNTVTSMFPSYKSAHEAGSTVTLSCVAPSGAQVVASVAGATVQLEQVAATAVEGVPARFKGDVRIGAVNDLVQLGAVTYTMTWKGSTQSFTSAESLYAYPQGETLLIQMRDTSVPVFEDGTTTANFVTTAKIGAVAEVVGQNEERYELAMGGWVVKENVLPYAVGSAHNQVSDVTFSSTIYGERYIFHGTGNPIATTWQRNGVLHVELHNTAGISSIPLANSNLFTDVSISLGTDSVILEFTIDPNQTLWGYVLEYDDGVTTLYCKYKPELSGNPNLPLEGIIVGLDAGHGGTDPGALGTARLMGPVEKDITYATALAVKKRLESLGATVLLPEQKDSKSSAVDRMQPSQDEKADLFLSLHCNSVAGNGLRATGVEAYYYESRSKNFADILSSYVAAGTGRTDRGEKWNYFRVTLSTLSPAVLLEMGFISHPQEYDNMCSKQGIFDTANAIGDSIIDYLS